MSHWISITIWLVTIKSCLIIPLDSYTSSRLLVISLHKRHKQEMYPKRLNLSSTTGIVIWTLTSSRRETYFTEARVHHAFMYRTGHKIFGARVRASVFSRIRSFTLAYVYTTLLLTLARSISMISRCLWTRTRGIVRRPSRSSLKRAPMRAHSGRGGGGSAQGLSAPIYLYVFPASSSARARASSTLPPLFFLVAVIRFSLFSLPQWFCRVYTSTVRAVPPLRLIVAVARGTLLYTTRVLSDMFSFIYFAVYC